jgi:hypothetical protein
MLNYPSSLDGSQQRTFPGCICLHVAHRWRQDARRIVAPGRSSASPTRTPGRWPRPKSPGSTSTPTRTGARWRPAHTSGAQCGPLSDRRGASGPPVPAPALHWIARARRTLPGTERAGWKACRGNTRWCGSTARNPGRCGWPTCPLPRWTPVRGTGTSQRQRRATDRALRNARRRCQLGPKPWKGPLSAVRAGTLRKGKQMANLPEGRSRRSRYHRAVDLPEPVLSGGS